MSNTTMPPASTFRTFVLPKLADVEPEIFVPRHLIHRALLAGEANTLGWDTVNPILLPVVNKTLEKSGRSPKSFNAELQSGWTVSGTFEPWRLVRGGSGAIVFMQTPVKDVKMTFTGQPDMHVKEGFVNIAIKLNYLPQPPAKADLVQQEEENGTPQYLTRNADSRNEDDPAVVIHRIDYGNEEPSELQKTLFRGALEQWYNQNLKEFTYVFTVVSLNAQAASGAFQWLKPTYTSYAYLNGTTDDTSFFGVLNMTNNNSATGLTNQLSPNVVPAGSNSALLISNAMFLRQMVLPGLNKTFTKASAEAFKISVNNESIENTTNIRMDDLSIDGSNYHPELEEFTFQIVGDEIQIYSKTHVNISPGIDVYLVSTNYYTITLVNKTDGTGQTLDFVQTRNPRTTHWYTIADWIVITDIIIGIIGSVLVGVANGTIKSVARKVVAVIIIAIVAGLLAAIPTIIAKVLDGKAAEVLPSIGKLVTESTGDIKWPQSSGFKIKTVELNGSLQLGGDV